MVLWKQVTKRLRRGHSPEQIVLARRRHHAQPVSTQAIYDYLERDKQQGGRLYCCRRKPPRSRARHDGRTRSWAHHAKPFRLRPPCAARRHRVGHLELDTMEGKKRDGVRVLVAVDRLSGYVWLQRLARADAHTTLQMLRKLLLRCPNLPIRTVTTDRGMEFAQVPHFLPDQHYVCDPYQPNQRALCENTIGLLREKLPKGQSLAHKTQSILDAIAEWLNTRPRKRLNSRTPQQVLFRSIRAAATRT
jgi:IS30 family transposase